MTTIALQHKAKAITLPAVNWKAVYLLSGVSLFLLVVFYIYSINALTSGSYAVKSFNKEIGKLEAENIRLEANVAASGFLGSVQEKARQLNFEKTTQVKYIEVIGTSLAKSK